MDHVIKTVPGLLRDAWQKLLFADQVDQDIDFFTLGGDSILMVRMLASVQGTYEREFDFSRFLSNPTLRVLSQEVAVQLAIKDMPGEETEGY